MFSVLSILCARYVKSCNYAMLIRSNQLSVDQYGLHIPRCINLILLITIHNALILIVVVSIVKYNDLSLVKLHSYSIAS